LPKIFLIFSWIFIYFFPRFSFFPNFFVILLFSTKLFSPEIFIFFQNFQCFILSISHASVPKWASSVSSFLCLKSVFPRDCITKDELIQLIWGMLEIGKLFKTKLRSNWSPKETLDNIRSGTFGRILHFENWKIIESFKSHLKAQNWVKNSGKILEIVWIFIFLGSQMKNLPVFGQISEEKLRHFRPVVVSVHKDKIYFWKIHDAVF